MNFKELSEKHLTELAKRIQGVMISKNMVAGGEAFNSLEVKGNKLLGASYLYYLDKGRAPGGWPPLSAIRDWIRNKLNIPVQEEKAAMFLIGRKIARDGTSIYRNNSKGLQLDTLIDEMLENLTKELPEKMAAEAFTWL